MCPHSLEAADQHPEPGGVEELDLLHVHHELVKAVVHQLDQKLAQTRRGVDVDLAFHVDDLDPILGVVIQLQIHKNPPAPYGRPLSSRAPAILSGPGGRLGPVAFNHALGSCLYQIAVRGTPAEDDTLKLMPALTPLVPDEPPVPAEPAARPELSPYSTPAGSAADQSVLRILRQRSHCGQLTHLEVLPARPG